MKRNVSTSGAIATWVIACICFSATGWSQSSLDEAASGGKGNIKVSPPADTAIATTPASGGGKSITLKPLGSARALLQPRISVTPDSISFGPVCLGDTSSASLVITNTGSETLSIFGGGTTSPEFVYMVTDIVLAPDSSRTVSVAFAPSDVIEHSDILTFLSNDLVTPELIVPLSGEGSLPAISGKPLVIFANAAIGATATNDYVLTNTSSCVLLVDSLRFAGDTPGDFSVITGLPALPFDVPPGTSLAFTLQFKRSSTGARSATLEIFSNAPTLTVTLDVIEPSLTIVPASIFFDDTECGTAEQKPVTLGNAGADTLILQNVALLNGNFTLENVPASGTAIAPGDSTTLLVVYTPAGATSTSDSLVIESNDVLNSPAIVDIAGQAIDSEPPVITCPDTVFAYAGSNDSALVDVSIAVDDSCDPMPSFSCSSAGVGVSFPAQFGLGTAMVNCIATDSKTNASSCSFFVIVSAPPCSIAFTQPGDGAEVCSDSVAVAVAVVDSGSADIVSVSCTVNDVSASRIGDLFTTLVPLSVGSNQLVAECLFTRSDSVNFTCTDTITVVRQDPQRDLVLSEILYDPNCDDLGAEKIEIKNNGSSALTLNDYVLWVDHGGANTFWSLPKGITIDTMKFYVIHWLADGTNDAGNGFTGLPFDGGNALDTSDGFWGDNSATAANMVLGGAMNDQPFAIALVERIAAGDTAGVLEECRLVDFAQIGGELPSQTVADNAGVWSPGTSVPFVPEGASLVNTNPGEIASTPTDYEPKNPSIGNDDDVSIADIGHLLISELCVRPSFAEFIEIYNPTGETIPLSDYYLTDNSNGVDNAYTLLTLGVESMLVADGDFFVRFPSTATIAPGEYQTIALDNAAFAARYGLNVDYEIAGAPGGVTDMIVIKNGSAPRLSDGNEMLMLLQWNGSNDLVKDVDYIVWGDNESGGEPMLPDGHLPAKFGQNPGNDEITSAPLNEAVDKTGLGRDGNGDGIETYYNCETPRLEQYPVASFSHGLLRSWQRRIGSRPANAIEQGERKIGGNGLTGHDETSEKLGAAFVDRAPTPGERLGDLDLEVTSYFTVDVNPNGDANRLVNPDETVGLKFQLTNFGADPTGTLIGILHTDSPFIIAIEDSISMYTSIAPGDSAYPVDPFIFATAALTLPDTIYFDLIVVQKENGNGLSKGGLSTIADVSVDTFTVFILTNNAAIRLVLNKTPEVVFDGTSRQLRLAHRVKNTLKACSATASTCATGQCPPGQCPTGALLAGSVEIRITDSDPMLITSSGPPLIAYGDIGADGNSTIDDEFLFTLADQFSGYESLFVEIETSWDEPGKRTVVTDTLRWPRPDSLIIGGVVRSHGQGHPIPGAMVRLEQGAYSEIDTTEADGTYAFEVRRSGVFELSVAQTTRPRDAITKTDMDKAATLIPPPNIPVGKGFKTSTNIILEKIAANVDGVNEVSNADVMNINTRIGDTCFKFPVGKDWLFFDTGTPPTSLDLSQVKETKKIGIAHFNFEGLDFTGILFGDVDGSANYGSGTEGNCTSFILSGNITYFNTSSNALGTALVKLGGSKIMDVTTGANGVFAFSGLPAGLRYSLNVAKQDDVPLGAITVDDLTRLADILEEIREGSLNPASALTSFAGRAADVNLDGLVTPADSIALKHYLDTGRQNQAGAHVGEWSFFRTGSNEVLLIGDTAMDFEGLIVGNVDTIWPLPVDDEDFKALAKTVEVPAQFFLAQNYPNPFNPATTIVYGLPEASLVRIVVFDLLGRMVAKLIDEKKEAGYYELHWPDVGDRGSSPPSGIYLVRMNAGQFTQSRKLTLLK